MKCIEKEKVENTLYDKIEEKIDGIIRRLINNCNDINTRIKVIYLKNNHSFNFKFFNDNNIFVNITLGTDFCYISGGNSNRDIIIRDFLYKKYSEELLEIINRQSLVDLENIDRMINPLSDIMGS